MLSANEHPRMVASPSDSHIAPPAQASFSSNWLSTMSPEPERTAMAAPPPSPTARFPRNLDPLTSIRPWCAKIPPPSVGA
jgi:hypothetical protein